MGNRTSPLIGHVKNTKKLTLEELFWQKVNEQINKNYANCIFQRLKRSPIIRKICPQSALG